ncbi:MAG: restriction endonuclease [Roseiarcus sp.]
MIRSPEGQYADQLLEKGVVAIGWGEAGQKYGNASTPEEFYQIVRATWPDWKPQQIVNAGRQLYKFFREMKVGDIVATYDSPRRLYHVGTITGEAQSAPPSGIEGLPNFRRVKWEHQIGRDRLLPEARNSLGSTLTIFQPSKDAETELFKAVSQPESAQSPEATPLAGKEAEDPLDKAKENSRELVKDKLMELSWKEMQDLMAGILRAMGYKTKTSKEGPDRGKDIIASPDALRLEHPRIFVEVKHRTESIGAPDIRTFIGGRDPVNDRCVYVSTGGFTKEAKYEAERSRVPLTLVDADELVELLIEHYETTDAETRTLIPLRKTYWPV